MLVCEVEYGHTVTSDMKGTLTAFGPPSPNCPQRRAVEEEKKATYRAELEAQIQAKKEQKKQEKAAEMEEELKKDAEIKEYIRRKDKAEPHVEATMPSPRDKVVIHEPCSLPGVFSMKLTAQPITSCLLY